MLKTISSKVVWVGRAASIVFGLVLVLALIFGVATAAFGANGASFLLGESNVASAVSKLIKQGAGPALELRVDSGAPLKVNSDDKVTNLNADKLDDKNAGSFLPKATYTKSQDTTGTDVGGGVRLAETFCDGGDVVLSGGHFGLDAGTTLVASGPEDFHEGWQLQWINDGTADSIDVSVYCADFGQPH
jgi:hypothetical protein